MALLAIGMQITISARTIFVATQADFDILSSSIEKLLKAGETDIEVRFLSRKLYFHENQLSLQNLNYPKANIVFDGRNANITSCYRSTKTATTPDYQYLKKGKYYNPWSTFYQANDTVEIINSSTHLCRIENRAKLKENTTPKNQFIQITCWFTSKICPIQKIDKQWIYFEAKDWALPCNQTLYTINMDYRYRKMFPRFRIMAGKKGKIQECTESRFLLLKNCHFQSFCLRNFNFTGSASVRDFITISKCSADSISISSNYFEAIGGTIVHDDISSNIHFKNNVVNKFWHHGIVCEPGSEHPVISGNTFTGCTTSLFQGFAIMMRGNNFMITDNTLSDFSYSAIGAGIWWKTETDKKCGGIIKSNHIYYTPSFFAHPGQHTLMDSGAIYTWTKCDGIVITENNIHDINGMCDNRGIFLDDGTRGVSVTDNHITNVSNSYDIDLRMVNDVKAYVPDHNTKNKVSNNFTTGQVRVQTK